jgi:hypothetical protein
VYPDFYSQDKCNLLIRFLAVSGESFFEPFWFFTGANSCSLIVYKHPKLSKGFSISE